MIVRKITVEHFGRFLEPLEVTLDPARPNLLAGPNGSGKSTLLAALTSAFTVSATSAAQEIRRWQPWQRALHPRVTVEFEHGGLLWRLSKEYAFGPRGRALLECFEGGQWLPRAQGRNVEERLPEFLGAPHGGPGSWLVAGVLWARQNGLAELNLEQPLQERVRASLGAQIRSGPVETVLRNVRQRYNQDWPPQGMALRQSSPVLRMEAEVETLRGRVRELQDSLAGLEDDRAKLEHVLAEGSAVEGRKSALETRLKELGDQLKQKTVLDAERLELEKTIESARRQLDAATTALNLRQTITADLEAAARTVFGLEERLQQARTEVKLAEDAWIEARTSVLAGAKEARSQLQGLNAPPQEVLDKAARLEGQLRQLEARLEGALLHVRLELEASARIEVRRGSPEGVIEGRAGEPVEISGSPEIELALPGLGRMRIWGPSASVEQLKEEIAQVRSARETLLQPWGSADLELLTGMRRQADELERQIESLQKELAAHEKSVSPEAAAVTRCRDAVRGLEEQLRQAQETQRSLQQQKLQLDSDPRNDAALQQAKEEAARRLAVAGIRHKEVCGQLELLPRDLEQEKSRAEDELVRLRSEMEENQEQKARLSERIEQKQREGTYALLVDAEERLAAKEQEYVSARRVAHANRLLWQTLDAVLTDAERLILPGLESRTTELLGRVQGGAFGGVTLDPGTWTPRAVHPAAVEAPMEVEPDRISGGEQEQLYLALRLALADILTEGERQLVVLDDVLLATDAARLARILELIEERRQRMQFLILTCHPERFSELGDVHLIRTGEAQAAE